MYGKWTQASHQGAGLLGSLHKNDRNLSSEVTPEVPISQNESVLDLLSWDFSRLSEIFTFLRSADACLSGD